MKILLCTNAFETVTNGPAKFAHLLLDINQLADHEIRILTEDIGITDNKLIYKQILRIPRCLKPGGMFLRMFQYHKQAMKIKKQYNFDVLVYNNAIVGIWSAIKFRKTIGFINDDTNATASWKNSFPGIGWNKTHIFFLTEKFACFVFSRIIVNSDYMVALLKKKYHIEDEKIQRLYKAIELPYLPSSRNNKIPVILFVKNDFKRGGLFFLIEAIKETNRKIKLIVAGPAPGAIHEIEDFCLKNNVEVEIQGILPQQIIYSLMQRSDIFCVPSYKEALGVANMEAMANDCSIITTDVGGIKEVTGDAAWLVPPGNIKLLSGAIIECLDNEQLRREKKEKYKSIIQKFNKENMISNFLKAVNY